MRCHVLSYCFHSLPGPIRCGSVFTVSPISACKVNLLERSIQRGGHLLPISRGGRKGVGKPFCPRLYHLSREEPWERSSRTSSAQYLWRCPRASGRTRSPLRHGDTESLIPQGLPSPCLCGSVVKSSGIHSRRNIKTRSDVHVATPHPKKSVSSVQIGQPTANAEARTGQSSGSRVASRWRASVSNSP